MAKRQHGLSGSPEHNSWSSMRQRCLNTKTTNFHLYGGRGITITQSWVNSFENFLHDMGPRPSPNHTLDRINPNGNYEPNNCRWATAKEQATTRRKRIGRVNLICNQCGKVYSKIRARADKSRFCSHNCLCLSRRNRRIVVCVRCGTKIERIQSAISDRPCCSRKCQVALLNSD